VVVLSHNGLPLAEAPDGILAGRAADGDVRSFEVLVRRHGPLMRAYASRILGSAGESDDIVQEAFITAWDQLPTVKDLDAVKSWLMRITSRKAIDRIRSRRDHAPLDEVDPAAPVSETPHQRVELSSQWDSLSGALARLTDSQRQCWLLREMGGYSYDEIAEELEIPSSTVRGLLARARRTLVEEMEEWR
jgi:RNA polymerase sigma-70 factor (ECF subfamily)